MAAGQDHLLLGVATADITPPLGVTLMGYAPRLAESIGHPLRAEALACAGPGGGWILVVAEVCAFSSPLATRVRADIAARTGLPLEAIMLAATHTHSGPQVSDALWCERSPLESAYFRALHGTLVAVAEEAWRTRHLGSLVHAQAVARDLASNRRVQAADGAWHNAWSDPDGRHPGYCDPVVDLVGIRRETGALDALLVNFGCHPVCLGQESTAISGDYVSYLKDALEARWDVGTAMFTVSGHANIDPRHAGQCDPQIARRMGEALAAVVGEALPALAPVPGTRVAAASEPWRSKVDWSLSGRLAEYFPFGETAETSVSALAAGDLVLLGLPGEAVSEFRERFRQDSPFLKTVLVSLANDFVGYLVTDEILAQGAYEADMCPSRPMEAALTIHVQAVLRQARQLADCPPAGGHVCCPPCSTTSSN